MIRAVPTAFAMRSPLVALFILAAAACPASAPPAHSDAPAALALPASPAVVAPAATAQDIAALRASVRTSRPSYARGEVVTFLFRVETASPAATFEVEQGSCGRYDYTLAVAREGQNVFGTFDYGRCAPARRKIIIADDAPYEGELKWDQRRFFGESDTGEKPGAAVEPGTYRVTWTMNAPTPVSATATFTIR